MESEPKSRGWVVTFIHAPVNLEAGGVVHFGPDTAHAVAASSLEDPDVKSMADAMRGRRNARESSSDDSDFGSVESGIRRWRCRREHKVEYILNQDVDELERSVA